MSALVAILQMMRKEYRVGRKTVNCGWMKWCRLSLYSNCVCDEKSLEKIFSQFVENL